MYYHISMEENKINLFTQREKEVLALILKGYKNNEIAKELFITNHTVKAHLAKIYDKIGVNNKVQAAIYVLQNGMDKYL